eukprot:TRINITY_DN2345_c0_g1_i1.p1 TRINITY_DN2345_c0_g1~~TRINITY_DN2345_c0_g1_i1.p1  ORF type:complete len:128 (-),score=26.75 TRINITY_DN2345_c0_g1_i1:167-550(-)
MSAGKRRVRPREDGHLLAIIADEDTVTGFVLAGAGHVDSKRNSNFLVVNEKTTTQQIEAAFRTLTTREDIGVLIISQYIAETIRHVLDDYSEMVPAILEIPSKDHPYEPKKDSLMLRVSRMTGRDRQ